MIQAYRQLAAQCDYPLHLGVTEAGPAFQGTIKSAVAFGALLAEGIGDTIRVSLSAPPVEEIKVGNADPGVARTARARPGDRLVPVLRARPGRRLHAWPSRSPPGSRASTVPLRVAVMGCVVNGPGEAREADLGVASGNGKGQIFVRGEVIKTVPESQIVETLIEEAHAARREMEATASTPRRPTASSAVGPSVGSAEPARLRLRGAHVAADEPGSSGPRAATSSSPADLGPPRDASRRRARPRSSRFVGSRDAWARCVAARRRDVGLVRGRRADGAVLRRRQPGAGRRDARRPVRAFADRARRQGRRCSSIVGPAELIDLLWRLLEPALGPGPRGPPRPAPHGRSTVPAAGRAGSAGPPGPPGRDRHDPAGVRGHVHRGGRRLPAGRRRRPLYRARVAELVGAGRLVRPHRGRPGGLQGRDRRGHRRTPARCRACGWPPSAAVEGLAAPGMAAVVRYAQASIAPVVTLVRQRLQHAGPRGPTAGSDSSRSPPSRPFSSDPAAGSSAGRRPG